MWNLSGDDLQKAKEELKGRRAAIRARYENELKQLETEIADLEAFERAAMNIVSQLKGDAAPAAPAAAPAAEAEPVASASEPESTPVAEPAGEQSAETEPAAESRPAAAERGSSRWRMRLGSQEGAR